MQCAFRIDSINIKYLFTQDLLGPEPVQELHKTFVDLRLLAGRRLGLAGGHGGGWRWRCWPGGERV